jgi:hypothetical protein
MDEAPNTKQKEMKSTHSFNLKTRREETTWEPKLEDSNKK